MRGTITRTIAGEGKRRFGFIRDEEGNDRFFHEQDLRGGLRIDAIPHEQRVEFDPTTSARGLRATNVCPARRA